ncbi:SAPK-interacting protein 1 [Arctopsyche grandis]|uniref:SAPK-interacting protein 1 n=1 Tax=Arctopsyche grandis TaxID=121162 RepID=UPI00406D8F37
MATYDNRHWLLAHVRNSFISTDDTGMCEIVMQGEDLPKLLRASARIPVSPLTPLTPLTPNTPNTHNTHSAAPPTDSDSDSDFVKERCTEFDCYPDMDQSDEEDMGLLADSYDLQDDVNYVIHRQRSNTAQRLEKMEHAQRKAAKIKIVKWETPNTVMSKEDREQLFTKKELKTDKLLNGNKVKKKSLLSDMMEKCLYLPQNQYLEFAPFDGSAQYGCQTKTIKIFMTMLAEELRNYPIIISVIASAKIRDLIGLICYKYSISHPDVALSSITNYGLFFCEDDGEVDTGLPCLDATEPCSKYGFTCLGLVDLKTVNFNQHTTFATCSIPEKGGFHMITIHDDPRTGEQSMRSRSATFDINDKSKNLNKTFESADRSHDTVRSSTKNGRTVNRTNSTVTFKEPKSTTIVFDSFKGGKISGSSHSAPPSASADIVPDNMWPQSSSPQETEALNRMKEHELSMEAPTYKSYKLQIVNKMRANAQVLLGVSGDKIEIEPFLGTSNIFRPRMKPMSYNIDCIAWCEIIEAKSSRSIFRIIYTRNNGLSSSNQDPSSSSSSNQKVNTSTTLFKHFDFECGHNVAKDIVEKVNMILELKSSACRREYKAIREKKLQIRRSFHQPKNY